MSKLKRLNCILLAVIFIFSFSAYSVYACSDVNSISLYDCYCDGILFQQNKPAVISGKAPLGTIILLELIDSSGKVVASGSCISCCGEFKLQFVAPKGSFENYSIKIYTRSGIFKSEKTLVKEIKDVVFGELWLGSGQSNMTVNLALSKDWNEMVKNNDFGNEWLRFLCKEDPYSISGSVAAPYYPQNNLPGCYWITGGCSDIFPVGAVDYYFAKELQKSLNIPVGVLCIDYSGSSVVTWLSRKTIESSPETMTILNSRNQYIGRDSWKQLNPAFESAMTGNYNALIYPLRNFSINGIIWYQGEADIAYERGQYTYLLGLLQKELSNTFYNSEGSIPLICTTLVSYHCYFGYDDGNEIGFQKFNSELIEFVKADPKSRAMINISDVPLDYNEMGVIHPIIKAPVGKRFAQSALGLVYGLEDTFSAPYYLSQKIVKNDDESSIYIKFGNAGDGLCCSDKKNQGLCNLRS